MVSIFLHWSGCSPWWLELWPDTGVGIECHSRPAIDDMSKTRLTSIFTFSCHLHIWWSILHSSYMWLHNREISIKLYLIVLCTLCNEIINHNSRMSEMGYHNIKVSSHIFFHKNVTAHAIWKTASCSWPSTVGGRCKWDWISKMLENNRSKIWTLLMKDSEKCVYCKLQRNKQ